jgi:hypothetical protein
MYVQGNMHGRCVQYTWGDASTPEAQAALAKRGLSDSALSIPPGATYSGDFHGKLGVHGVGRLQYPDGSVYEGGFRRNLRHGRCKLIFTAARAGASPATRRVDGSYDDGLPDAALAAAIEKARRAGWRVAACGVTPRPTAEEDSAEEDLERQNLADVPAAEKIGDLVDDMVESLPRGIVTNKNGSVRAIQGRETVGRDGRAIHGRQKRQRPSSWSRHAHRARFVCSSCAESSAAAVHLQRQLPRRAHRGLRRGLVDEVCPAQ